MISNSRRTFLTAAALGAGAALTACAVAMPGQLAHADDAEEASSPLESLASQQGLLSRVLLIYDEAGRRLTAGEAVSHTVLSSAAQIVRDFIENFHEKLLDEYVFPKFAKAGKLSDLVPTLTAQHKAGHKLTDTILALADEAAIKDAQKKKQLIQALAHYARMYRPLMAREATVVYPEFADLVSDSEDETMGKVFAKREEKLFGKDGFEQFVEKVAAIEKELGLYDLAQYTV